MFFLYVQCISYIFTPFLSLKAIIILMFVLLNVSNQEFSINNMFVRKIDVKIYAKFCFHND